jgi:hypothetical protein
VFEQQVKTPTMGGVGILEIGAAHVAPIPVNSKPGRVALGERSVFKFRQRGSPMSAHLQFF